MAEVLLHAALGAYRRTEVRLPEPFRGMARWASGSLKFEGEADGQIHSV